MKNITINKRIIGVAAAVVLMAALVAASGSWGGVAAKTSVMNAEISSLNMSPGPDVPHLLNYQGVLNDKDGKPILNEVYQMTFGIYDSTADGTKLWSETQIVHVRGGLFNVLLGSVNSIPIDVFQSGGNR